MFCRGQSGTPRCSSSPERPRSSPRQRRSARPPLDGQILATSATTAMFCQNQSGARRCSSSR
eukprot:1949142-Pyramimonas_sp.AAC.1